MALSDHLLPVMELRLKTFDFGNHAFDLFLTPLLVVALISFPSFLPFAVLVVLTLFILVGGGGFLLLLGQADTLGR